MSLLAHALARCEITLTNVRDGASWLDRRLAILSYEPSGYGELRLEVRGPSGEIPYVCHDNVIPAGKKDYAVLEPGDSLTRPGSLSCFFGFKVGETYTARAHFHDENPDVPLSPPSAVHLSSEIVSEPVQFEVVK